MTPSLRSCAAGFAALAAVGCYQSHRRPEERDAASADAASADGGSPDGARPPPPARALDVLFVLDNSISMAEEQRSLVAELPRLVSILVTGDFDQDGDGAEDGEMGDPDFAPLTDLHLGVVTTDLGSGGFALPGCPLRNLGDDGVLRTRGAATPGCATAYPSWLTFRPRREASPFVADAACVLQQGTAGCGLEQPLEAALKALSPRAPTSWTAPGYSPPRFFRDTAGHGDGANAGFARPGSLLLLVLFTDDDDCSAADPSIFDGGDRRWVRNPNLRCSQHAEALLHPLSRYVEGLLQLRRDPSRLVFALVAGVPVDLTPGVSAGGAPEPTRWGEILADPRMQQVVDPSSSEGELVPSCARSGAGLAFPPRRLVTLGRELERRGAGASVSSICQPDLSASLGEAVRRLDAP